MRHVCRDREVATTINLRLEAFRFQFDFGAEAEGFEELCFASSRFHVYLTSKSGPYNSGSGGDGDSVMESS
jgi:hypothetical protein